MHLKSSPTQGSSRGVIYCVNRRQVSYYMTALLTEAAIKRRSADALFAFLWSHRLVLHLKDLHMWVG